MMPCVADDVAQKRGEDRQWHAGNGHWNAAKATKNAKNNAWGAHLRMMDLNAGSCAQKMQKKTPAGLKMAFLPALMFQPLFFLVGKGKDDHTSLSWDPK